MAKGKQESVEELMARSPYKPWDPKFEGWMNQQRAMGDSVAYSGFDGSYGGDASSMPSGLSSLEQLQWKAGHGKDVGMNSVIQAAPGYQGITAMTPNGPVLPGGYHMNYGGLKSFDQMKNLAYGKGPSDMYKATSNAINLNRNASLDDLAIQSGGNLAAGNANLAMTGGLESGARERLGESNALSRMLGQQGIYAGADQQRAGALIEDNKMKTGLLSTLAGYDAQAKQMNVNNLIQDKRASNMFDLERWGKMGDIIGSGKTADAMQNSKSDKQWYEIWK